MHHGEQNVRAVARSTSPSARADSGRRPATDSLSRAGPRRWSRSPIVRTMTRWNKGSEVIESRLENRHLEEVPADAETVDRLIATARRHIESATTSAGSDPEGALASAYDAARKTATALLGHQGLRRTSAGGHIATRAATRRHRTTGSSGTTRLTGAPLTPAPAQPISRGWTDLRPQHPSRRGR